MHASFRNPPIDAIRMLLERVQSIAVVGLSPRPTRPSHGVAAGMQRLGYRIIPVRPAADSLLGERAYADLYRVPDRIDLVNVFRAPQHVGPIVDACIALGLRALWLQDGVINETEAARAHAAGIEVIMDRCVYRDYLRLLGSAPRRRV